MESEMNAHRIFHILTVLAITLGLAAPAGFTARAEAPANDNFANAMPISEIPFTFYQNIFEATMEEGEPLPSCVQDISEPGRTVWFTYTPGETGAALGYFYGMANDFLAVYQGTNFADLSQISCTRNLYYWNSTDFAFNVQAGQTYYLQLGHISEYGESVNFQLEFIPPPLNDNFADAVTISESSYSSQYTSGATIESNEPIPSCDPDQFTPGHTVWFKYDATSSGRALGSIFRDYDAFLAVYRGIEGGNLEPVDCWKSVEAFSFEVMAGETYFLQIGSMSGYARYLEIYFMFSIPPDNDNFSEAMEIEFSMPYEVDNSGASTEINEPIPPCIEQIYRTVWFRYMPSSSGFITASNFFDNFVAAYSADNLGNLTLVGCSPQWNPLPIKVEAGIPYYFQVGTRFPRFHAVFTFQLYETPMPTANFGWSPWDPNVFDSMEFCDWSEDPAYVGISEYSWDFGDGTSSSENCAYHQYKVDGDYTVFHNITTADGRTDPDGVTNTVSVRTHEVAITKVTAPLSASARQSRTITVEVRNTRYPETVRVVLYKSLGATGDNYQEVGAQTQYVPVRSGNRTSRFVFNYTFSPEDAAAGKVSFKAVAELQDYREANPVDNESVSIPPTKVSGKLVPASMEVKSPQ
jgi:PKD repeat protein